MQKANDEAFVAFLKELSPAVTALTSYGELEESFGSDARFQAVGDEDRRRMFFALHQEALLEAEQRRKKKADDELVALYR